MRKIFLYSLILISFLAKAQEKEKDKDLPKGNDSFAEKKYDEAETFLIEAKTFLIAQNLMIERTSNATKLGHLFLQKGELEKAVMIINETVNPGHGRSSSRDIAHNPFVR